jgi:thiamine pyrophosphate-dependent acetolactate synthase large subunit-like protein
MDNIPLLVLATGIRNDLDRAFQLHDIDQMALAHPVTKGQIHIDQASDLYSKVKMACVLARTPPAGPVVVEIPANLLIARVEALDGPADTAPRAPLVASETQLQQVIAAIDQSEQAFSLSRPWQCRCQR